MDEINAIRLLVANIRIDLTEGREKTSKQARPYCKGGREYSCYCNNIDVHCYRLSSLVDIRAILLSAEQGF
jgi:hypothetical protein